MKTINQKIWQNKTLKALRNVTRIRLLLLPPFLLMQHSKIRKINAILKREIKIVIRNI